MTIMLKKVGENGKCGPFSLLSFVFIPMPRISYFINNLYPFKQNRKCGLQWEHFQSVLNNLIYVDSTTKKQHEEVEGWITALYVMGTPNSGFPMETGTFCHIRHCEARDSPPGTPGKWLIFPLSRPF